MADRDISFATFNLENLQHAGGVTYPGARAITAEDEAAKIRWVADRLRELDADVIGFQEVWSAAMLGDCFTAAGLAAEYDLVARDATPGRVQVALAARKGLLLGAGEWVSAFPDELVLRKRQPDPGEAMEAVSVAISQFSRPILRAEIAPDIGVYVAHLKSKLPIPLDGEEAADDAIRAHSTAIGSALSLIRRAAEATALRVMLTKVMKGTAKPVVVIGDLNDNPNAVSTSIITADPALKLFNKSQAGERSDTGLYSVSELQEMRALRDVYYTYIHGARHESLDHILVSEQFYDHSRNRRWSFEAMRIWNDHIEGEAPPGASDHAVVRARFRKDPVPA